VIERRNLLRLGLGLAATTALSAPSWAKGKGHGTPAHKGGGHHGAGHPAPHGAHHPHAQAHAAAVKPGAPRHLAFRHLHTGETLEAVYWEKGAYVPDALAGINHLLRDFRSNEEHPIDLGLLDLLNDLRIRTATKEPFRIISGFRSPQTNEMLREQSADTHGQVAEVAKKSLHMEGQAVDIRLIDVALTRLHTTAMGLKRGGVGFYPDSDFIHVDVGAVRYWQGT
jgi:uncharacterized protein YcbK (DUF882 family)